MERLLLRSTIMQETAYDIYERGRLIAQRGLVGPLDVSEEDLRVVVSARVSDRRGGEYYSRLALMPERIGGRNLTIMDFACDCEANEVWGQMCRHCTAVALAYSDRTKQSMTPASPPAASRRSTSGLGDAFRRYAGASRNLPADIHPGELHAELTFSQVYDYGSGGSRIAAAMTAGTGKRYVVKSIPAFLHSVVHGTEYRYGKNLSVFHSMEMFDQRSARMLRILLQVLRVTNGRLDSAPVIADGGKAARWLTLDPASAAALMRIQAEPTGLVELDGLHFRLQEGDPSLTMTLQEDGDGAALRIPGLQRICPEPDGLYALRDTIYCTTPAFQANVLPFLHAMGAADGREEVRAYLAREDYTSFCALVLPRLRTCMQVDTGNVDFSDYMPRKAEFRFYLSQEDDDTILLRPEAAYGALTYPLLVIGSEYRDREQEQEAVRVVEEYFPHAAGEKNRTARGDAEAYRLLESGLEALRKLGEVYMEESMRPLRWSGRVGASLGVTLAGDLIDIHVEVPGMTPAEINSILEAYRRRKKYCRLSSGEFLSLTEGGLSVVAELSGGLAAGLDENGSIHTEAFRAQFINSVVERENTGLLVRRSPDFKKQIRTLKDYRDSDYELPQGLQASVRGYQLAGFRWLCSLWELGLGGILADDMGLGKTLQVLSCCLYHGGRTLVICPASLIYNWESECRKFTPGLQAHLIRGTPQQRREALSQAEGLFITSYEQLRRDLKLYEEFRFDCCILDEAQYIRNAATKAARAVKTVRAAHRFALTGTPIENRLSDLWSIFDFLMPGYLYSYGDFRARIEQDAAEGDEEAIARLARLTAPFLLRRKKKDVLQELPDKVEQVLYVEMTPEQRKLYNAQEQALRLSLLNTPEAEFLHQKIRYLSALTRLRQICCTPELYLEDYAGGAAKVDACLELLKESAEAGHKTLVFSQFTGMLDRLIRETEAQGIHSLCLSGKNTAEERRDMVQRFQTEAVPVFFISLKAGGTGLNLTAADRVIHFDPWWNAAAEDQASDRTHRIGQKNTVFVTRLVCRDSVEERILDLQTRKRGLSDMVVNREALQSASLNRDELLTLLEGRAAE